MLSKDAFSKWFQDDVLGRWAQCAFTAQQVSDWYWRLKHFEPATLTNAVRRHYVRDEPRRPSLKKIYEYAQQQTRNKTGPNAGTNRRSDASGVPDAHTYIQCVSRDENGCGPVGWFVPILLWPFHRTYTRQMFDAAAENQRRMHQQNSGGMWEVVSSTTHSKMLERQLELTGQTDRVEANAAKITAAVNARKNK